MKSRNLIISSIFLVILGCPLVLLTDASAAAEAASAGRKIWDNVMLFVNFFILLAIFLKFGRKPLMDYLRSVGAKIESDVNNLNGQLDDVKTTAQSEQDKIKSVDKYIKEIRESILEIGKKEKEKIITDGKFLAEKMVKDAHAYSEYRVAQAKRELTDEMVDKAIGLAGEKLKENISADDNENLINQFITKLQPVKN